MRISDWSSYVCSSDLFVFVVTWASLQPPRPAAFPAATARPLRGVALSVPSFPALRRLLLSACLAAAVALPFGAAAKAETLQLAPAPFKALPEGTAMVWENMDTGKKVQGGVGSTRGPIVTWTWEGRSFSRSPPLFTTRFPP